MPRVHGTALGSIIKFTKLFSDASAQRSRPATAVDFAYKHPTLPTRPPTSAACRALSTPRREGSAPPVTSDGEDEPDALELVHLAPRFRCARRATRPGEQAALCSLGVDGGKAGGGATADPLSVHPAAASAPVVGPDPEPDAEPTARPALDAAGLERAGSGTDGLARVDGRRRAGLAPPVRLGRHGPLPAHPPTPRDEQREPPRASSMS